MKTEMNTAKMSGSKNIQAHDSKEDFKPGETIAVLTLLLGFIASSVYILISGYLNIV